MALTDGLIALYHLDTDSVDSISGNNGVGTGVTYSPGVKKVGAGSVLITGSGNIQVPDAIQLALTTDCTIAVWGYINSLPAGSVSNLVRKGVTGTSEYSLGIYDTGIVSWGSSMVDEVTSSSIIAAGQWYLFMVTRSGGTNTIYINDPTTPDASGVGSDFIPNANNLCIGVNSNLYLDELAIWDRALTQTERQAFWNTGTGIVLDVNAVATPLNVVANNGDTENTISWDAVAGATHYDLYWGNTPGVTKLTGTKIASVTSPYVHTGLTNGTNYYYVVVAGDAQDDSPISLEVSATPQVIPVPDAPTGIAVTGSDTQNSITWNSVSGATSYNLYWDISAGVTKATGNKITGVTSPYVHTSLTNGVDYFYIVTSVGVTGESLESTEASATPFITPTNEAAIAEMGQLDRHRPDKQYEYKETLATTGNGKWVLYPAGIRQNLSIRFKPVGVANGTIETTMSTMTELETDSEETTSWGFLDVETIDSLISPVTAFRIVSYSGSVTMEAKGQ